MKKTKRRRNVFSAVFFSRFFFFVLILILAGVAKISFEKFKEWQQAHKILISKEEKIEKQKERKEKLEALLRRLQNEDYLKNITKERLNLVEPEERVIYVLPEKEEREKEESSKDKGFLEKLREMFKKGINSK